MAKIIMHIILALIASDLEEKNMLPRWKNFYVKYRIDKIHWSWSIFSISFLRYHFGISCPLYYFI